MKIFNNHHLVYNKLVELIDNRDFEKIQQMISQGLDLNIPDPPSVISYKTLLVQAIENNDLEMCNFLIENGINFDNNYDYYNWSLEKNNITRSFRPLHNAILCNNNEIFNLLIEKGADINGKSNDYQSPFKLAVECYNIDFIKLFVEKYNINFDDMFVFASCLNDCRGTSQFPDISSYDILSYFIDKKVDVNHRYLDRYNGATALFYACAQNRFRLVNLLLKNNSDIHLVFKDPSGQSDISVFQYIKKRIISDEIFIKLCSESFTSSDFWMTTYDDPGIYQLIINFFVFSNFFLDNISTGIIDHYSAIFKPYILISHIKYVLREIDHYKGVTSHGSFILYEQNYYKNYRYLKKIINESIETGCIIHDLISVYINIKDQECADYLLNKINDIIDKNINLNEYYHGNQPIHYTVGYGITKRSIQILTILLSKNIDINSKNINNETVLHLLAKISFDSDLITFLITKGSLLDVKDKKLKMPLHNAVLSENVYSVKCLISSAINDQDINKKTPLDYAIQRLTIKKSYAMKNQFEIISLLVKSGGKPNFIFNRILLRVMKILKKI